MGRKIVAVRKDHGGRITHVRTNRGEVLSLQEVQSLARLGEVDSLTDVHADGSWEIAHTAGYDGEAFGQNLSKLPEF